MNDKATAEVFGKQFEGDRATGKITEMPATTQVLPCSKCGREQVMPARAVMFFCHACSATMGQKK